jgi:hypothetical protein
MIPNRSTNCASRVALAASRPRVLAHVVGVVQARQRVGAAFEQRSRSRAMHDVEPGEVDMPPLASVRDLEVRMGDDVHER